MEIQQVISDAHPQKILCTAYNPYNGKLFTGSEDNTIKVCFQSVVINCTGKVWDTETGKLERTLTKHEGWVTDLLYLCFPFFEQYCWLIFFSDKRNYLFSGSLDGTIVAWNHMYKQISEKRTTLPCSCLAWDSKREHLIAGELDIFFEANDKEFQKGMKAWIYVFKLRSTRYEHLEELLDPVEIIKLTGFVRCMCCFDGKIAVGR